MKKKEIVTVSGSSVTTTLLVVFVVLKLVGVIDWSWWWVLAPFWIPAAFAFLWLAVILAVAVIEEKMYGDYERKNKTNT